MTDLEPSEQERAYAAEQGRLILARVRWAAGLALLPISVSAVVNALVFSDHVGERIATHGVQIALCGLAAFLSRSRFAERWAVGFSVAFILGINTTLLWAITLSPRDLDVLACPVASTMMLAPLIFPWGLRAAAITSGHLAAGYLLLLPWASLGGARITNVMIGLVLGVATSLVGAYVLDRQRRLSFIERENVEALARERELLLECGRELNGTTELSSLVGRIIRQAHRLVGSTAASLTLYDEQRGVFRPVAVSGDDPERYRQVLNVEFPIEEPDFLEQLARDGVVELPNGTPADRIHEMAEQFGYVRTLFVAVQRERRLLGMLAFAQRASERPLDAQRRNLAEGIAHQAAIALVNAHLVDDLQRASQLKSEFLSTMSHELRTPLNVILGFVEMARDEDVDDVTRAECLARLEASGRDLLGLIESTLEIGRIEAGRDELQLGTLALASFWARLGEACARIPRKPGVALDWSRSAPPISITTDARKLTIIIRNLVGNALKFTEHGFVRAEARLERGLVVLRVEDTGIGIRLEDRTKIFEMFRQADGSDSRRYNGTGLGLYIVRRFVEQLGGTIAVDSAVGRGSVFSIKLPGRDRVDAQGESARAAESSERQPVPRARAS